LLTKSEFTLLIAVLVIDALMLGCYAIAVGGAWFIPVFPPIAFSLWLADILWRRNEARKKSGN
jgi:CHASE2 domain-containing sensor protein